MNRQPLQSANSSVTSAGHLQNGFTLLEILLALAIMAMSFAVLSELTSAGLRISGQSQRRIQAATRCEAKLAELLTGVEPLKNANNVRFRDDPSWLWSVDIRSSDSTGMQLLTVRVFHAAIAGGDSVTVSLHRLVRSSKLRDSKRSRR